MQKGVEKKLITSHVMNQDKKQKLVLGQIENVTLSMLNKEKRTNLGNLM